MRKKTKLMTDEQEQNLFHNRRDMFMVVGEGISNVLIIILLVMVIGVIFRGCVG